MFVKRLVVNVNYILRENSRKIVTWFRYSPWRSIFRYIYNFGGRIVKYR